MIMMMMVMVVMVMVAVDRNGQVSQFARGFIMSRVRFDLLASTCLASECDKLVSFFCFFLLGSRVVACSCCFYDLMPRTPRNFNYTANPTGRKTVYMLTRGQDKQLYRATSSPTFSFRDVVRPSTAARCQI